MRAARLFFAGQLTLVIDSTVPLVEVTVAQQRLEQPGQFGNIVREVP